MTGAVAIDVKSPTRVDLAGGTLDCWPLFLFLNNPVTVNLSIDIFTRSRLVVNTRGDSSVRLVTRDLGLDRRYTDLASCLADSEPAFDLIRVVVDFFRDSIGECGFSLETLSESPVGGGLGGSSSLCISILKAFSQWLGRHWVEGDLVRLASHLEARLLLKPTGTQDYFPPIQSGLCVIEYGPEGPVCRRETIEPSFFSDRFMLVYTGRSHHSGINNWQVIKDWLDGDRRTRESLSELALISKETLSAVRARDPRELAALFRREFDARVRLSTGFSSPEIAAIGELALRHGSAAKICGAGGGGCVFIWSPEPETVKRNELIDGISAIGARVLPAKPYFEAGPAGLDPAGRVP